MITKAQVNDIRKADVLIWIILKFQIWLEKKLTSEFCNNNNNISWRKWDTYTNNETKKNNSWNNKRKYILKASGDVNIS